MGLCHFMLGLLAGSRGYLESLDWLIRSPSFGSLYPALHGLLKDGLVTVFEICRSRRYVL